jgi:hypothetical protein
LNPSSEKPVQKPLLANATCARYAAPQECNHLINLAAPHMKTSNVVDRSTGKSMGRAACSFE